MKKLLLLLTISFLFASCDAWLTPTSHTIQNLSSVSVSFTILQTGEQLYTLAPAEELTQDYVHPPRLTYTGHPRVTHSFTNTITTISDMKAYSASFFNSHTLYTIVVSEQTNSIGAYGDTVTLAPGEEKTVLVYSSSPVFSAVYTGKLNPAECAVIYNPITETFSATVR